jgi:hypothetical protein
MEPVTPGWKFVSIGIEGDPVSIQGVNVWAHEWQRCSGETITVAHPSYPSQRHAMFVYDLAVPGKNIRFAAGEFSNSVWGIYAPT